MKALIGISIACIAGAGNAGAFIGYMAAIAILLALMLWGLSIAWSVASRVGRGV